METAFFLAVTSAPALTLTIGATMSAIHIVRVQLDDSTSADFRCYLLHNAETGAVYFDIMEVNFGTRWDHPDLYPQLNLDAIGWEILQRLGVR